MKLCLACSQGGHMTELQQLQTAWEGHDVFYITYSSPRKSSVRSYEFKNLGEKPLRALPAFLVILSILLRERPDWVVSDGAEIAVPVFAAAWLLRIPTLFIESFCRVTHPSMTGRLVYPLADVFLVQWPELLTQYGSKARYFGAVI